MNRDYYLKNREEIIRRVGEWQKRNPERVKAAKTKSRRLAHERAPYMRVLYDAKARALKKSMAFDLTKEWAAARWTGRCELTGAAFSFNVGKPWAFSLSLDRIDPKRGYTQDNCRFILWAVNRFKSDYDDATMFHIARLLMAN